MRKGPKNTVDSGLVLCCLRAQAIVALALMLVPSAGSALELDPVTIQLKWRHHFQFAGYYAAVERGFYRDAGLDVRLVPWKPDVDVVGAVLAGEADFGVAGSELAVLRGQGKPVVSVAVIFQHSPLVLFARRDAGIGSVHDLPGKRVMLWDSEADPFAYLKREGVAITSLVRVPATDDQVTKLLARETDVISGYSTDEAYELRQAGVDVMELTPRSAGIDFYGDVLFTSEATIRRHPDRVAAFRRASLQGWAAAMRDLPGTAELIRRTYAPDLSLGKLQYEGERMTQLLFPDLIELGYQHQGRWESIAATYREVGMLTGGSMEGLIYRPSKGFLDEPSHRVILAVLLSLLVVVFFTWRYFRLSRELARSNAALVERLADNERLQAALREEATHDPLTGLSNRRHVLDLLPREFARADREQSQIGFVAIDVDHFKAVNDRYGHSAGDAVLLALARLFARRVRDLDICARWGGEEFLLVLPGMTAELLLQRVEEFRLAFQASKPVAEVPDLQVSFSAGIALYPRDGTAETVIEAADRALYAAKVAGRNRVVAASDLAAPTA